MAERHTRQSAPARRRPGRAARSGRAGTRSIRRGDSWGRMPRDGHPDLRAWFAADSGGDVNGDDVVITPGGQAGLALAVRALTVPGDAVVVESPTYLGVLEIARSA